MATGPQVWHWWRTHSTGLRSPCHSTSSKLPSSAVMAAKASSSRSITRRSPIISWRCSSGSRPARSPAA